MGWIRELQELIEGGSAVHKVLEGQVQREVEEGKGEMIRPKGRRNGNKRM